jgi:hypothetical protein
MVNTKSTLLGIAFDSGFNSKATFQSCVQKKNAGRNSKEYLLISNINQINYLLI